jgi:hypothetical protein
VVDLATNQCSQKETATAKEATAAEATLGRLGGPARAKKLSPKRRSEIAKQEAAARWEKKEA